MSDQGKGDGILHLLLSGDARAWRDCLAACCEQDTVLLLDAGVMALAVLGEGGLQGSPCRLAVSALDAQARGLSEDMAGPALAFIKDEDIVALIEAHRHCLSWR